MIHRITLVLSCCLYLQCLSAQSLTQVLDHTTNQEKGVKAVIDKMFEGMAKKDTTMIADCFSAEARLNTAFINNKDGKPKFVSENISNFIAQIGGLPAELKLDEKLWSYTIQIDGPLATAWTPYSFFVNGELQHCGVNAFQLHQTENYKWKIHQITDTRTKQACKQAKPETKAFIDTLLSNWHQAAADADLSAYFDATSKDLIYMGTDPAERWDKAGFFAFCKPYFDKKTTWDFTATQREVYLNDSETIAWFEETLDTHMGPCRGSGVLRLHKGEWKIDHYVLSLVLPNEDIDAYRNSFINKGDRIDKE